jgi:hypothetical protein
MDNVFSFFMCALRYQVARQLAGSGALYWRRREFGYRQSSTRLVTGGSDAANNVPHF